MVNDLLLHHKGKAYPDFSFIKLEGANVGDKPRFEFEIENLTSYEIENIRLITNAPESCYDAEIPLTIPSRDKAKMTISLDTEKLFTTEVHTLFNKKEQRHQLLLTLEYDKSRVFQ